MRKSLTGSFIAVLSLAGALGCSTPPPAPAPGAAPAAPAAAAPVDDKGPIKIGILHSLSGTMAISETSLKDVALMTIEEINEAGGVLGRKIEVVSRDDNGNPGDAVRVAEELLSREGASILIGTFPSNIMAKLGRFTPREFFDIDDPAKGPVPVQF